MEKIMSNQHKLENPGKISKTKLRSMARMENITKNKADNQNKKTQRTTRKLDKEME
jgi:hypothetical protein